MPSQRVVVFSLTYNERDNIRPLVEGVLGLGIPGLIMVVADDNSPDGTGKLAEDLAREYPGRLLLEPGQGKRGYGAAYRATVAAIREKIDPDVYVSMDADLSHDAAAIPALLAAVGAGAQVAIGSRYVKGGAIRNWPRRRRVISRGANTLARMLAGNYRVHDNTSGFRAFTRDVVDAMPWETFHDKGYQFLLTFLSYAYRKRFRVVEVPITFTERVHGASKLRTRDVVGFFGNAARIRMAILTRRWAR
ncbi:MAG: glycosyltransferase [Thermoplasmatota archaeon]